MYVLGAGLPPPHPPFYIKNLDQLNKEGQEALPQGAFSQMGGL